MIDESEAKLTDLAMLEHKHCYRNDCGQGYQGGKNFRAKEAGELLFKSIDPNTKKPSYSSVGKVNKKSLIVVDPSPVKYGLQKGSGDLVGWTPVKITPESIAEMRLMGKTIAVFTSIEIKTIKDKPGRDQIIWYFNIKMAGGIAIILHCNEPLTTEQLLAMSRRTEAAGAVKDKIIDNLYAEYKRRRGIV